MTGKTRKTTVGNVSPEVLAFTAGEDRVLDQVLVDVDCIGTAAHVQMLSEMPIKPPLLTKPDCKKVLAELRKILKTSKSGKFKITLQDQDVHLAVERTLTKSLGDLGKKVHTGRSRNDQVALDMRLYMKIQLLHALEEMAALIDGLLSFAAEHKRVPMVGRTHMQPAMPSSVGLWASAHAEALLDDASPGSSGL